MKPLRLTICLYLKKKKKTGFRLLLWLQFGPCSKATMLLFKVSSISSTLLCFVLYINLYIPPRKLLESSPFMVDAPDRGTSMSASRSVQSTLLSPFSICTDGGSSRPRRLCFHFRQEEISGVIWSGFPTHLLSSFLLTQ